MYRTITVGILGMSLMVLPACESMTGKTTGQTIDDATVTASVQDKLTGDKLSDFSRINVDTERSVVTLNGVGPIRGREITGEGSRAAGGRGENSEQQPANSISGG